MAQGGKIAVTADDFIVSKAEVKALKRRTVQLERVLGSKILEVKILSGVSSDGAKPDSKTTPVCRS